MSDNGLDFKPIISYTYSISILMINFKSFFHKYTILHNFFTRA